MSCDIFFDRAGQQWPIITALVTTATAAATATAASVTSVARSVAIAVASSAAAVIAYAAIVVASYTATIITSFREGWGIHIMMRHHHDFNSEDSRQKVN